MRISKVYTRTGDAGDTGLVGGKRVRKDSPRVAAYGEVDEANSAIGLARALLSPPERAALDGLLARLQDSLFVLGAELASPPGVEGPSVGLADVKALETEMDRLLAALPPLREFVLPGGSPAAAALHLARATTRRAERAVVALATAEPVDPAVLAYVNRLSDLLFVLAREANRTSGTPEVCARLPGRK